MIQWKRSYDVEKSELVNGDKKVIISVIGDGTGKFKIRLNYVDGLDAFCVIDSSSLMEAESYALDIASKRYDDLVREYGNVLDELNDMRYKVCRG